MKAPGKRLALLGAVVAALAASAPAAAADDVWLWACHAPNGEPMPEFGDRAAPFATARNECSQAGAGLQAPAGSGWTFEIPTDTTLSEVKVDRTVALGSGEVYTLRANDVLETGSALSGTKTFPATGSRVSFDVACPVECVSSNGAAVSALAFRVSDATPPTGSVGGWHSPAADTLDLEVRAVDTGLGLKSATAVLDGVEVATARFGDDECADLSAGADTIDLPFALVAQNDNIGDTPPTPVGCVGRGTVTLPVNTKSVADATDHTIEVYVTDLANHRVTVMNNVTEVRNTQPSFSNTATLDIGSSADVPATRPATNPGGGGVAGASATSCRSPRLSMELSDKPLRTSKGVVVLRYGQPYRFTGRLTCEVGDAGRRRRSARRSTSSTPSARRRPSRPARRRAPTAR